jgi:hypothetical protein
VLQHRRYVLRVGAPITDDAAAAGERVYAAGLPHERGSRIGISPPHISVSSQTA